MVRIVDMYVRLPLPLDRFHDAVDRLCEVGLIDRRAVVSQAWSGLYSVVVGKVHLIGCTPEMAAELEAAPVVVTVRGLSQLVSSLTPANSLSVHEPEAFDGGWSVRVEHIAGQFVEYLEFA